MKNQPLEELFEQWENKQCKQNDVNADKIEASSFLPDGIIDEAGFENARPKLLFIAKESNMKGKSSQKGDFWLKRVYEKEELPRLFGTRIIAMANAALHNNFESYDKNADILESVAFMNINKRGGALRSSDKDLKKYAKSYCDEIKSEIEIISPDIIVCCGDIIRQIIESTVDTNRYKVCTVRHPSYFRISNETYLKEFKASYENAEKLKHESAVQKSIKL